MTRNEFYNEVLARVKERLSDCMKPDQIVMERQEMDDGKSAMLLLFLHTGNMVSPGFNLDVYYEQYLIQMPMDEYIDSIEATVRDHVGFMEATDNLNMDEYGKIRGKVRVRLVSHEYAKETKSSFLQMELPLFTAMFFVEFRANGRCTFIPIWEGYLEKWNKSMEDLLEQAEENLIRDDEIILTPLEEAKKGVEFDAVNNFWKDAPGKKEIDDAGLLLLTTRYQYGGASLLISEMILKKISDILGADYYVLPSSGHEVMLLPDYRPYDIEAISSFVRTANETQVLPEDVLSNEVLFYDRETGQLLSAKEYEKERRKKMADASDDMLRRCIVRESA